MDSPTALSTFTEFWWWQVLVGLAYSTIVGYAILYWVGRAMWRNLGRKTNPFGWHAKAVGVIERVLYTVSWLTAKPEFIVGWLVLKVAGQWKRWEEDGEGDDGGKIPGRAVFNVFLIGNGLSIAFGIVGGLIVQWLKEGQYAVAVVVPVVLACGACAVGIVAERAPADEKL